MLLFSTSGGVVGSHCPGNRGQREASVLHGLVVPLPAGGARLPTCGHEEAAARAVQGWLLGGLTCFLRTS